MGSCWVRDRESLVDRIVKGATGQIPSYAEAPVLGVGYVLGTTKQR
jgi:hypothetical protein